MDEEDTRDFREPCERCSVINWAISDEGKFFCKSCHNVIEKTADAPCEIFMQNARVNTLSKGLKKRNKLDQGCEWYVCEGFQYILNQQAKALVALGTSPLLKTIVDEFNLLIIKLLEENYWIIKFIYLGIRKQHTEMFSKLLKENNYSIDMEHCSKESNVPTLFEESFREDPFSSIFAFISSFKYCLETDVESDETLCNIWRRYLQKSQQAYTNKPIDAPRRQRLVSDSSELVSDSDVSWSSLTESNPEGQDSSIQLTKDAVESEDEATSIRSGSVDGSLYRRTAYRKGLLMSMPLTLAFCYLALLWLRESITLADLLRFVSEQQIPYLNAFQYFPEEMKLYGPDIHIFQVQIPSSRFSAKIFPQVRQEQQCVRFSFQRIYLIPDKLLSEIPKHLRVLESGTQVYHRHLSKGFALLAEWLTTSIQPEFQSIPSYEEIQGKMHQLAVFLEMPRFPEITEKCFLHPDMLCIKLLMEANLPENMHIWIRRLVKKMGIGEVDFLTYHPLSRRAKMVKYEVQAAAVIVVALKLLFVLNDKHEWLLSNRAKEINKQNSEGIKVFQFKKWYTVMRNSLDEREKEAEDQAARHLWKCEKPLFFSVKDKSVIYKKKRMIHSLKKQFVRLAGSHQIMEKEKPSSFKFNWNEGSLERLCFREDSLKAYDYEKSKRIRTVNDRYWVSCLNICQEKYCGHLTKSEEKYFPGSYLFILQLFSFLLGVEFSMLHLEVCQLEHRLFNLRDELKPRRKCKKTKS